MEISSNVCLTYGETERFQAVYASQIYGTFFGVFARFDLDQKAHQTGKGTIIKKVHLLLLNYKGEKNIEIVHSNFLPKKPKPGDDLVINILVKTSKDSAPFQDGITIDFTHLKGGGFSIKNEGRLLFVRETLPLNPDTNADLKDRAFVDGDFDSEFFIRDGIYVMEKPRMQYEEENKIVDWPPLFPSPSCTPGNNLVLVM